MSALAKGYPTRTGKGAGELGRRSSPRFPANDPRKLPNRGAKPIEVFKWVPNEPVEFGRRTGRRAVGRFAAGKIAGRLAARAVPFVGTALAAAEVIEWIISTTPGEPIPRDPNHSADVEWSFPTYGWVHSQLTYSPPHPIYDYLTGQSQWVVNRLIAGSTGPQPDYEYETPHSGPDTIAEWWTGSAYHEVPGATDPASMTFQVGEYVERWEHWNNPSNPTVSQRVGDSRVEDWRKSKSDAENPVFANPQRVSDPVVVVVPVPRVVEAPQPFRRVRDDPDPAIRGEPSLEPSAPAPPMVPPTIVIEGRTRGRGVRPRWRQNNRVKDRIRSAERAKPRERARKGEKEKEKPRIQSKGGAIFALVKAVAGHATEFLDFVNAAYKALPDQYKPGYFQLHFRDKVTGELKTYWKRRWKADFKEKAKAVWDHWEHIPNDKLVQELLKNEAQDRAFAKLGRASQNAAKKAGRENGWQLGEWDTASSKAAWEAKEKARIKAERAKVESDKLAKWYKKSRYGS